MLPMEEEGGAQQAYQADVEMDSEEEEVEQEEGEEGGEEEGGGSQRPEPSASQRQARADGLRYIRQRNAERDLDPAGDETVLFGYVVELFGSRRHRRLPPSWRNAMCTCAILHFQRCLSARDADPTDPVLLARKIRRHHKGFFNKVQHLELGGGHALARGRLHRRGRLHAPPAVPEGGRRRVGRARALARAGGLGRACH